MDYRPIKASSPGRLADDESAVLRRRLQYALDEIAHLSEALRDARGQSAAVGAGPIDALDSLRGEVEALRTAIDQKDAELDTRAEEQERLQSRLRELAAAHDEALERADRTTGELLTLRRVVTQLRRLVGMKALSSARKEARHRVSETSANDVVARTDRGQPDEQPEAASSAFPGTTAAQGTYSETVASTGPQPAMPATAPKRRSVGRSWPARVVDSLPWALGALAIAAAVVWPWYGPDVWRLLRGPKDNPAKVASAQPPVGQLLPAEGPAGQTGAQTPRAVGSRPVAQTPAPRQTVRDRLRGGGFGPEMVAVGPGAFTMGSSSILAHPDEWPPRAVTVGRFLIGAKEITFSEYDAFARSTGARLPSDFGWGRGPQPVVDVSWDDATTYAEWLARQTGHRYRLPTEAEWEFAARGDTAKSYWWGYERGGGHAVCFDCGTQWDNRKTAPVASLTPNAFGLYDTAGNAMEWVTDCWSPDYTGAAADTRVRTDGDCRSRVARGGAFNKTALAMRSAARNRFAPATRIDMLGFRVVREN